MLNYMKSEFYRIFHSATLYVTISFFAGLGLMFNIVLYLFGRFDPNFAYSTTSFSFSNIVGNPMLFCFAALIIVYVLYERSKKNGSLKNAVAFGISRTKVFLGQLLVSSAVSVMVLVITETVCIASALLLLPNEGPVTVRDMLFEIVAVFPAAVSALVFGLALVQLFDRSSIGILIWLSVFYFIPKILFFAGMAVEPIMQVAMWLPYNLFLSMQVNMTQCVAIWDTAPGLARCLITGFVGIGVFGGWGIVAVRKKEI